MFPQFSAGCLLERWPIFSSNADITASFDLEDGDLRTTCLLRKDLLYEFVLALCFGKIFDNQ